MILLAWFVDKKKEGTETYDGICKDKDDAGVEIECEDEAGKSCMTSIITITISTNQTTNPETKYLKNCAETEQYHASGCLTVDNENGEFSMKGSICYCETNKCNTNYDANNNNS